MDSRAIIERECFYESGLGQTRKKSDKIITVKEAASYVKDGSVLMVGGFIGVGSPLTIIDQILKNGTKDLTLIANDTVVPDKGTGKMIVNKQFKKIIVSHIGTNPETGKQMNAGELEVELVPQGTLAERIRAGGSGLGGILTPTGIGTEIEEGKQKITINGKEYLIELPLRADIALIKGYRVDKKGNIYYNKAARNFNPLMAMAADLVIVEADEIVEVGEINPNDVVTPGVFVDYIVKGGNIDG
ncbi:MAG TPA: acetate CoA-transferase subunit alpha [Thermoanaerobacterales bacterium]|nr:acetate CoA-transferase subunit alpha [Thermoanaerobacterales bacterium]